MNRRLFLDRTIKAVSLLGVGHSVDAFSAGQVPPDSRKLRFLLASDGHFGQPGTEYEMFHDEMMSWINAEHNGDGLDFAFFNGDLVHDSPELLHEVKRKYQTLTVPYFVSRGNHDTCSFEQWVSVWNYPLNYSFERNGVACVVLDTSNEKGEYVCPDFEWTKSEIDKYVTREELFLFMHITPRRWTDNGIACQRLVRMFARYNNIKAVFHGHDHDRDGMMSHKGVPYFFDGHLGGSWGVNYRGYRIVEVFRNGQILTYQVNPAEKVNVNSANIR